MSHLRLMNIPATGGTPPSFTVPRGTMAISEDGEIWFYNTAWQKAGLPGDLLTSPDAMVVEGAGTAAANRVYVRDGSTEHNLPIYSSPTYHLWGLPGAPSGPIWVIGALEPDTYGTQDVDYISDGVFLTPEAISGWIPKGFITANFPPPEPQYAFTSTADKPDPTVRRGTRNDL